MCSKSISAFAPATAAILLGAACIAPPQSAAQPMPTLVQQRGRATLMVDYAPNFMPGAQVDNSSGIHSAGKQAQMLKVEEGRYDGATWVPTRLWNGDETDYGLNFGGKGSLLRITMGATR